MQARSRRPHPRVGEGAPAPGATTSRQGLQLLHPTGPYRTWGAPHKAGCSGGDQPPPWLKSRPHSLHPALLQGHGCCARIVPMRSLDARKRGTWGLGLLRRRPHSPGVRPPRTPHDARARPGPRWPPNFTGRAAARVRPTCAPAEGACCAREVCAWPQDPRKLPAPPARPLPTRRPLRPRAPRDPLRLSGSDPDPAGETEAGRRERPPQSAVTYSAASPRSLCREPRPPDADSHPPKLAAGAAARAPRRRAPGGAATSDPGSPEEGARERRVQSPFGHPRCTPRRVSPPPATVAPSRALTRLARTGPARSPCSAGNSGWSGGR